MRTHRRCSKSGCAQPAVATLTYVYADSTAVVGPLATFAEPHTYDLCELHARRLTAPRGWELVRHDGEYQVPAPTSDDLVALADAVREAGRPPQKSGGSENDPDGPGGAAGGGGRRGHLRVLPSPS